MQNQKQNSSSPTLTLWFDDEDFEYPKLEPAKIKRDWLDNTFNKIGYTCTPLSEGTSNGWEIRLPQDVIVKWDGESEGIDGENANHVEIISGSRFNNKRIATNESGVGQITFTFNVYPETDPDHYITISGPQNYIFQDAYPLTTLWRTDYYNYNTLMTSWKILTKDKEIVFPKGMPIAFIQIHKKDVMESAQIIARHITDEKKEKSIQYTELRTKHFMENGQYDFPQFYKKGIGPSGNKISEGATKISLQKVKYIND